MLLVELRFLLGRYMRECCHELSLLRLPYGVSPCIGRTCIGVRICSYPGYGSGRSMTGKTPFSSHFVTFLHRCRFEFGTGSDPVVPVAFSAKIFGRPPSWLLRLRLRPCLEGLPLPCGIRGCLLGELLDA